MFVVANASTALTRPLFEDGVEMEQVDEWLREFELWDGRMSDFERRERYSRLCKTEFELMPRHEWKHYYKDLLEVES